MILSDAVVKFQNAYFSLIHLSKCCSLLDDAAMRHRVCAQGGGTIWLPSFLTPRTEEIIPFLFLMGGQGSFEVSLEPLRQAVM